MGHTGGPEAAGPDKATQSSRRPNICATALDKTGAVAQARHTLWHDPLVTGGRMTSRDRIGQSPTWSLVSGLRGNLPWSAGMWRSSTASFAYNLVLASSLCACATKQPADNAVFQQTARLAAVPSNAGAVLAESGSVEGGVDLSMQFADVITPQPATADAESSSDAGANSPTVLAISLGHRVRCHVSPAASDAAPGLSDVVVSDTGGMIRFLPPPSTWGQTIIFTCSSLGGSTPPQTVVVDLSDSSTFMTLSPADVQPIASGTRPVLTGDLSAPSMADLAQGGYPPRPDPIQSPRKYAKWVTDVTTPMTEFAGLGVALIGEGGCASTYQGFQTNKWSSMIEAPAGFSSTTGAANPLSTSTLQMLEYYVEFTVAPPSQCTPGNCSSILWTGIGGWSTTILSGSLVVSGTDISLLQSGFGLVGSGETNVLLYYELAGEYGANGLASPAGKTFNAGDEFTIWAYASDYSSCSNFSSSTDPAYACYYFDDTTSGWAESTMQTNDNECGFECPDGGPTDGYSLWYPQTFEFAFEKFNKTKNGADFFLSEMEGVAWDNFGNEYDDPGEGTEPYGVTAELDADGGTALAWAVY